jgi:1-acyl-sn-glycerol-3-phosphate acyltransferase
VSRARKPGGGSRSRKNAGADDAALPGGVAAGAGGGFLGRYKPGAVRRLERELEDRLSKIPNRLNEFDYDPWGFNREVLRKALLPTALVYRYWFRARTKGIENVPAGRVLLIANHAGQIPIDAAMVAAAMILEGEPPRAVRAMGEYWLPRLPWFNVFMHRVGGVVGTPKNCLDLLNNGEAVEVFPEGVRGVSKLFKDRYKLARFGLGFMRLALQTKTPIVPVGIVGSEEQAPSLANIKPLARLLGMPAFPITPTWPFLGPLGLIPFPSRYYIHFGKPMVFEGDPDDEDHHIQAQVDRVKTQIARLIKAGKRRRKSIFL